MALENLLCGARKIALAGALGLTLLSSKAKAQEYPTPADVGTTINTLFDEENPSVSGNGRIFCYDSNASGDTTIWIADRDPLTGELSNPHPHSSLNDSSYTEREPSLSFDGLDIFYTHLGNGASLRRTEMMLAHSQTAVSPPTSFRFLAELEGAGTVHEFSPSSFLNGLGVTYGMDCQSGWACSQSVNGFYESYRPNRNISTLFDRDYAGNPSPPRRMSEFDIFPIGSLTSIDLTNDGLSAIVSRNNGDGPGQGDHFIVTRQSLAEQFDTANLFFLNPPDQPEDVNGPDDDSGAAFVDDLPIIYFHSNRPGGQGGYDLYISRPSTLILPPPEVSGATSPIPLRVKRDAASLYISFEELATGFGAKYNLYVGNLATSSERNAVPFEPFNNLVGRICKDDAQTDPGHPGERYFTVPLGRGSSFFLISASNAAGEGPTGYDSRGQPVYQIFHTCGPLP
ncbi:MAG TPA: hypothetical protein VJK52_05475 [Candidatus Nanoarchaeia archaeon]|nr:hypothetical protein [Candidatus Nanoarchaeia archaeon]